MVVSKHERPFKIRASRATACEACSQLLDVQQVSSAVYHSAKCGVADILACVTAGKGQLDVLNTSTSVTTLLDVQVMHPTHSTIDS